MSVEFAAVLPLVGVALLLVAQMGLLVAQQLTVQHAAREGARVAAIANDDAAATQAAREAGDLADDADVRIEPGAREVGESVRVTVRARPALVPLIGVFISADFWLIGSVQMRTERAPDA